VAYNHKSSNSAFKLIELLRLSAEWIGDRLPGRQNGDTRNSEGFDRMEGTFECRRILYICQKNCRPTITMFRVDSLFQPITASGTPKLGLLLSKGRFDVQFISLSTHASITSKRKQRGNEHRRIKRKREKEIL